LNEGEWEKSLVAMQAAYRAFVAKHGQLLQFTTRTTTTKDTVFNEETGKDEEVTDETTRYTYPLQNLLSDDPDSHIVFALESINEENGAISNTKALTERVLAKPKQGSVATPHDALLSVLNDIGHVDMDLVAAFGPIAHSIK
jgi:N12 class adenine-specific DNA methylase